MDNRVDYLSDRLVNLRGKHKSVHEVIPPDSIANGVSIRPAVPQKNNSGANSNAASAADLALERRREQTLQLYSDFEQRLIRRQKQIQLTLNKLESTGSRLRELALVLEQQQRRVSPANADIQSQLTPAELGDRYRMIDRERLDFFELDAELETLLNGNGGTAPGQDSAAAALQGDNFKTMLKRGAAYALTAGLTIGAAILLAALIIFSAWR